jgi:hypothetical protein
LDVQGSREELGCCAGGVEVGQKAIETGQGEAGMEAEVAAGLGVGMFVGEVLAILADEEQMEEALVDFVEFLDAAVGFGMGYVEAEGGGGGGTGVAGKDVEVEAELEGIGEGGDEVHAAAGAAAGEFCVDVGVHGAGEVGNGLGSEEGEEVSTAHDRVRRRERSGR